MDQAMNDPDDSLNFEADAPAADPALETEAEVACSAVSAPCYTAQTATQYSR